MNEFSKMILVGAAALATSAAVAAKTPAEKAAEKAEREAAKARQEAWKRLDKSAQDLMRKDFKGGFANYWHDNIDAARALYETALTNTAFANAQKIEALRQAAQMHLEATRDTQAALATMARAYKLPNLTDEDRQHADEATLSLKRAMRLAPLEDAKNSKRPEQDAFTDLLNEGYDAYFARVRGMIADYTAKEPKKNVWRIAWDAANQWWSNQRPTKAQKDVRFPAAFVALMESAPTNCAISAERFFVYTNGKPGLEAKCRAYAEKFLADAADPKYRTKPATIADAKRFLCFCDVGSDKAKVLAACNAWLSQENKAGDKAELAKLIGEQAQTQLKRGNEAVARELWDERLKIAPEKPQAKLDCPYWKEAPHDIRGIVESGFYKSAPKGLFDRRYGDNLKFLIETDSAITSRQLTTDKGEKFRPTELFAFCDARGVHIVIRAFLDNMADVKAGNAGVPGYEAYIATGIDDPYHCLMFDPKEGGKVEDGFLTMYDNGTGYRNLTDARGNLQYSNLYLDDSAVTLISVSWASTAASIPSRSPAWYFEAVNWAHGGLSWGGSKSVHWRSSFGEFKFTGVDAEALAAIQRTVLRAARQTVKDEKSARSGGYIEHWSDPVLGDQAFYLAVVKPYVERIDADLAKVTDASSPAEIAAVFATGSVDDALNITYRLAALRTAWLEEQLTK